MVSFLGFCPAQGRLSIIENCSMSPLNALILQDIVLKGRREWGCRATERGTSLSVRLQIVHTEVGSLWNCPSEAK